MGNNSKCLQQKNLRDPILRATAINNSGETFKCEKEEKMVAYMAKSNLSRQSKYRNCIYDKTFSGHIRVSSGGQGRTGSHQRYFSTTSKYAKVHHRIFRNTRNARRN